MRLKSQTLLAFGLQSWRQQLEAIERGTSMTCWKIMTWIPKLAMTNVLQLHQGKKMKTKKLLWHNFNEAKCIFSLAHLLCLLIHLLIHFADPLREINSVHIYVVKVAPMKAPHTDMHITCTLIPPKHSVHMKAMICNFLSDSTCVNIRWMSISAPTACMGRLKKTDSWVIFWTATLDVQEKYFYVSRWIQPSTVLLLLVLTSHHPSLSHLCHFLLPWLRVTQILKSQTLRLLNQPAGLKRRKPNLFHSHLLRNCRRYWSVKQSQLEVFL